jgi:hypothetical protein
VQGDVRLGLAEVAHLFAGDAVAGAHFGLVGERRGMGTVRMPMSWST